MRHLILFIVFGLLCGCGEPDAPMLHLTMKRDDGTKSVSRFKVSATGRIAESGDHSSDGAGVKQSVTIDKIADDGITLTVILATESPDSPVEESKKQMFVPYGKDITVGRLKDTTLEAHLERKT